MNTQLNKTEALQQAQQFIDMGRVASAIRIYQKIVEADASDLSVISILGELYMKAGRAQEAVEHFLKIAENYLRTGSAISATHILKKILKLDPGTARAHMHLGELYLREGRINHAHASFIEAGAAFWHKGNIAAAIKMNERALASRPDSRQAKTALALLEQEINQPELVPAPKPTTGELEPLMISIPDEPDTIGAVGAAQVGHLLPELPSGFSDSQSPDEFLDPLDEDTIVEQIGNAELLVGYGQADQAVALLRETLQHRPDHIQVRAKLKDIYLRSAMVDRATEECINIAGIYAARGESSRAYEYVMRARHLSHSVEEIAPVAIPQENEVKKAGEVSEENLAWTPESRELLRVM